MPGQEFRTEPPGGQSQGSDDWLERSIKKALKELEGRPEAQAQLASALQENYGVPMELMAPVLPEMGEGLEALQQEQAQAQAQPDNQQPMQLGPQQPPQMDDTTPDETPEAEQTTESTNLTPDDVIGYIDQAIDMKGEDTTLGEFKEWAEDNRDLINTAIALNG